MEWPLLVQANSVTVCHASPGCNDGRSHGYAQCGSTCCRKCVHCSDYASECSKINQHQYKPNVTRKRVRTRCCLAGRDFNRAADDDRQGQSHVWERFNSAGSSLASGLPGGVGVFPLARGLRPGAGSQRQRILSSRLGAVDIDIISPLLS